MAFHVGTLIGTDATTETVWAFCTRTLTTLANVFASDGITLMDRRIVDRVETANKYTAAYMIIDEYLHDVIDACQTRPHRLSTVDASALLFMLDAFRREVEVLTYLIYAESNVPSEKARTTLESLDNTLERVYTFLRPFLPSKFADRMDIIYLTDGKVYVDDVLEFNVTDERTTMTKRKKSKRAKAAKAARTPKALTATYQETWQYYPVVDGYHI